LKKFSDLWNNFLVVHEIQPCWRGACCIRPAYGQKSLKISIDNNCQGKIVHPGFFEPVYYDFSNTPELMRNAGWVLYESARMVWEEREVGTVIEKTVPLQE